MKIKTVKMDYDHFLNEPTDLVVKPRKASFLFATLIRVLSIFELRKVKFKYLKIDMDKLGKKEPCLILMNHSSFIDLKIASCLLYPRRYNIICTDDGFVGKKWLMKRLGCIPTRKFATDMTLVRNMKKMIQNHNSSILMYPEAGYSFDGTSTILPSHLSKCLKFLKVPVIMIKTEGAFLRSPLYNNLRLRNIHISATMKYLLSKEDIENKSLDELQSIIEKEFSFDGFKEQLDNKIEVSNQHRAESLNRVLYKCPVCKEEGHMFGYGEHLKCENCNSSWYMDEYGQLISESESNIFSHIPTWNNWQREEVKKEIENRTYLLDLDVDIYVLKNFKHLYNIGSGHLVHNEHGLTLNAFDGKLNFHQPSKTLYTLNSDFYWYEIGDVICIGDENASYYCFPKQKDVVAKARLATEEIYKLIKTKNLN